MDGDCSLKDGDCSLMNECDMIKNYVLLPSFLYCVFGVTFLVTYFLSLLYQCSN